MVTLIHNNFIYIRDWRLRLLCILEALIRTDTTNYTHCYKGKEILIFLFWFEFISITTMSTIRNDGNTIAIFGNMGIESTNETKW